MNVHEQEEARCPYRLSRAEIRALVTKDALSCPSCGHLGMLLFVGIENKTERARRRAETEKWRIDTFGMVKLILDASSRVRCPGCSARVRVVAPSLAPIEIVALSSAEESEHALAEHWEGVRDTADARAVASRVRELLST